MVPKSAPTFDRPYRVIKVQEHKGTKEVTGVCIDVGTHNQTLLWWFPRYHVRAVGGTNPSIQWHLEALQKE